jgi:ParB family chromosome partitioning protein
MGKVVLGRGLDALIPTAPGDAPTQGELKSLPLDRIAPNKYQPRKEFNQEALAELAESFKSQGVLQPILAVPEGGGYMLVAGERRYRAARLAGLQSIPALVLHDLDKTEMLQIALIENLQREDLNPIDTAEAYRRLIEECGLSQSQLGERVGKSRTAVTNTLRLLTLPDNIRALIADNKITEGHARAILAIEDPEQRERTAQKIINENMTVRQVESIGRQQKRRQKKTQLKRPDIAEAETRLKHALGTAVRIISGRRKGRIEIEYYGEDDLGRIVELLTMFKRE